MMTAPAGTGTLLDTVLNWCRDHPADRPLPEPHEYSATVMVHDRTNDTIRVAGEPPAVLAIAADLLDAETADSDRLTFADGTLTIHTVPEPLRYRTLGPDALSHAIVFERTTEATP